MKYIPAEKLIELISQTEKEFTEKAETKGYTTLEYRLKAEGLHLALQYITSLQQEQPEVDLEKEIQSFWNASALEYRLGHVADINFLAYTARHFYELGRLSNK